MTKPYSCENCGARGVKLWRLSTVCVDACNPICLECAREWDPALKGVHVREDGTSRSLGRWSDQLYSGEKSSRVPAVPTSDGSFYGYSCVPGHLVEWWQELPLSKPPEVIAVGVAALWCAEILGRGSASLKAWDILDAVGVPKNLQADTYLEWTKDLGRRMMSRKKPALEKFDMSEVITLAEGS